MLITRYPESGHAAIAILCLLLAGLTACAPKEPVHVSAGKSPFDISEREAVSAEGLTEIQALMSRALQGEFVDEALAELARIEREEPSPMAEEAAFRRVQLLLRFSYPKATMVAGRLLDRFPEHALAPYVELWLAHWWAERQEDAKVLAHTTRALNHARLTREVAEESVSLGMAAARRSAYWESIKWLFTAARVLPEQRDGLLRKAATRASLAMISRLREEGWLQQDMHAFYLYAARGRLLRGQISELQTITGFLEEDDPNSAVLASIRRWSLDTMQPVTIGVLLPLSGEYAHFGEQALRGIRLAMDLLEEGQRVSLRIEDTRGDPSACASAYRRLTGDGVAMVIGPLLAECAEALLPHLSSSVPVLSLTSHTRLAQGSASMFVHTLSLPTQAHFMADDAWQQGDRRMVLIYSAKSLSQQEMIAFTRRFESLGGEVVEAIQLPEDTIDFRHILRDMRARTDDEELLAVLDENQAYLAEPEMEIRMPASFDGVYLALPGRLVALVAGQLAYVDVAGVNLYGSSHWRDGKLLDDKGRYLSRARFSDVSFPAGNMAELRRLLLAYREVWGGEEKPGKLMGLAYDSTLIAAMLTSRMGLSGSKLRRGLMDEAGFPGLTGHVHFDKTGVGQKRFEVFTIRRGRVLPAS